MLVEIRYTKKALKAKNELSPREQAILDALELDLIITAGKPLGRNWHNLGPLRQLGKNIWHCHFTKDKVAVWKIADDGSIIICKFEYVGDRGNAPY